MFDININITVVGAPARPWESRRPLVYDNGHIPVERRVSYSSPGPGNVIEPREGTLVRGQDVITEEGAL